MASRIRTSLLTLGIFLAAALKLTFSVWFWFLSPVVSRFARAGPPKLPPTNSTAECGSQEGHPNEEERNPLLQNPTKSDDSSVSFSGNNSLSLLSPTTIRCPELVDTSDPSASSPVLPDSPATPLLCGTLFPYHSQSFINTGESFVWHASPEPDLESGLTYLPYEPLGPAVTSQSLLDASCLTPSKFNIGLLTSSRPGSPHTGLMLSRPCSPLPQFTQDLLGDPFAKHLDSPSDNAILFTPVDFGPLPSFTLVPPINVDNDPVLIEIDEPSVSLLVPPLPAIIASSSTSPFLALPPHAPTPYNSPHRASGEFFDPSTPMALKEGVLTQVLGDGVKMYRPVNTGLRPLLLPKEVAKRNPQEALMAPVTRNTTFCPKALMLPQKVARNLIDFDSISRGKLQEKSTKASKRVSANAESILCKRPQPAQLAGSPSLPMFKLSLPEENVDETVQEDDAREQQPKLMNDILRLMESSMDVGSNNNSITSTYEVGLGLSHSHESRDVLVMVGLP